MRFQSKIAPWHVQIRRIVDGDQGLRECVNSKMFRNPVIFKTQFCSTISAKNAFHVPNHEKKLNFT